MCCIPTRRLAPHRNLLPPSAMNGSGASSRDKRTTKCATYKKRDAVLSRNSFIDVTKARPVVRDQQQKIKAAAASGEPEKHVGAADSSSAAAVTSSTMSACPSASTSSSHLSESGVAAERLQTPQAVGVTQHDAKGAGKTALLIANEIEIAKSSTASPAPVASNRSILSAAVSNNTTPRKKRRRIRKKLPPGLTAKKNERQFVVHDYHDHSKDDPEEYLKAVEEEELDKDNHHQVKMCGGPGNSGGVVTPFPFRLHKLLQQIDMDGYASVISWQPHGRAFKIHNKDAFVTDIMPKYFNQSKLTSFQRQLNLYGFIRLSRGEDAGGYYHELFLKNMPFLCHRMIRTKCKGTGFKAASDPDSEPNFYSMPYVKHSKDYWKKVIPIAKKEPPQKVPSSKKKSAKKVHPEPPKKARQIPEDVAKARAEDMYLTALKQAQQGREQEAFNVDPRICPKSQAHYPLSRNSSVGPLGSRKTSLPLMCFDFQDSKNAQGQYMPPVPGSVMPPPQPFLDPLAIAASSSVAGGLTSADLPLDFLTAWDDQQPTLMYGNGAAAIDPYVAAPQSQALDATDDCNDYEPLPLVSPETSNVRTTIGNIVGRPYIGNIDLTSAPMNQPSSSLDSLELPFQSSVVPATLEMSNVRARIGNIVGRPYMGNIDLASASINQPPFLLDSLELPCQDSVVPATPQNSEESTNALEYSESLNVVDDDDSVMMQLIMQDASDMLSELNKDDALGSLDNDEALGHVLDYLVQ